MPLLQVCVCYGYYKLVCRYVTDIFHMCCPALSPTKSSFQSLHPSPLSQGLQFDLIVHSPYRALEGLFEVWREDSLVRV